MTKIKKSNKPMGEQLKEEGVIRKMRINLDGEFYSVEAVTPEEGEEKARKQREDREKETIDAGTKSNEAAEKMMKERAGEEVDEKDKDKTNT